MAKTIVPFEVFEQGRFPPVCCKTGERADRYTRWEFQHTPGWLWILLPFGVIPFMIASALATERFSGVLPTSSEADRRVRFARRMCWLFGIVSVASLGFGLFTGTVSAYAIGIALAILWGVFVLLGLLWAPKARTDKERRAVTLSLVHPEFVRAVETARTSGV